MPFQPSFMLVVPSFMQVVPSFMQVVPSNIKAVFPWPYLGQTWHYLGQTCLKHGGGWTQGVSRIMTLGPHSSPVDCHCQHIYTTLVPSILLEENYGAVLKLFFDMSKTFCDDRVATPLHTASSRFYPVSCHLYHCYSTLLPVSGR